METIRSVLQWFAGGDHPYHTLFHCMMNDRFWIYLTVSLDVAVAGGYALIAWHWYKNQRTLPATPAKKALGYIRNVFIFCAFCGYVFIPVKMFWPAWRLYDIFMAGLVYYTWRYAWSSKQLKVIYNELGQSRKLKEELEKSQRESKHKSAFLNALSHDLRTPLNGMLLQSQVARLSVDNSDQEALTAALNEIEIGARAAGNLLDSLLQCARLDWADDPVDVKTFPLCDSLSSALFDCRAAARDKGLTVTVACPQELRVQTDRTKLERIVANLANNAVKFTAQGGVRVVVEASDRNVEIHVIDTGVGVDPVHQAHLFDEFYQVTNHERDRAKGFGLGLAIAQRMARQLGGDIALDSAVGAGSRFTVLLPGVVAPADARRHPDAESVPTSRLQTV